jgi:hypothetical protein
MASFHVVSFTVQLIAFKQIYAGGRIVVVQVHTNSIVKVCIVWYFSFWGRRKIRQKINFTVNINFWPGCTACILDIEWWKAVEWMFSYRVPTLLNQLFSHLLADILQTLHGHYGHIEDMLATLWNCSDILEKFTFSWTSLNLVIFLCMLWIDNNYYVYSSPLTP